MIAVKNVTKRFGAYTALQGLTCVVGDASVYGLVGYNGAGKTTLLKTVAGIYRPEEGRVLIEGENIFENEALKQTMFFIPDDPYFLPQASLNRMATFYKGYYKNWNNKTYKKLAELFGLDPGARISGFSKGMQRQAAVVLALSSQPRVLLLDESFDGLDPAMRSLVKKILLEYLAEREISILISSHNLRELEELCDHVGLLNEKHVVFDSAVDDMRQGRNKYRMAFAKDVTKQEFEGVPLKHLALNGRIVTFVAEGDSGEIENRFAPLQPVLFESVPMTLEEIFLDEMEVKDYDLNGLF